MIKNTARKSLRVSFMDGLLAAAMVGLVESYFVPYGLLLKASVSQVGLLASFPYLVSALAQTQVDTLTRKIGSRRRLLEGVIFFQAVSLLLAPLVPLLKSERQIPALIGLATGYTMFGNLAIGPWSSLMCDYLPASRRVGYFGWRNRVLGHLIIFFSLLAGIVLHAFGKRALIGFVIIFCAAGVFRLFSLYYVSRMHEARKRSEAFFIQSSFSGEMDLGKNLKLFLWFSGGFLFAAHLVAPFFSVHMLNHLQFSYLTYTLLTVSCNYMIFAMMGVWGRHADHSGNLKVLHLAAPVVSMLPVLWLLSGRPSYIFVVQMIGGAVWSAFNLCTINYVYDSVPSARRIQAVAAFSMVNGVCIYLGTLWGSQLMGILPPFLGLSFYTLLLLSCLLRLAAVIFILPLVREVRLVPSVKKTDLLWSVVGLRPIPGVAREIPRVVARQSPGV